MEYSIAKKKEDQYIYMILLMVFRDIILDSLWLFAGLTLSLLFWFISQRHRSQAIAGATDADGFLQIILIGVWAFVGSASSGLAIEFLSVPKVFAQCVIFAFLSLASGLNALVTTQLSLHIYVSVFAFLANGVAAFVAPTMLEIVRKDQLPHANGQVILLCSISVLAGPPISGMR